MLVAFVNLYLTENIQAPFTVEIIIFQVAGNVSIITIDADAEVD